MRKIYFFLAALLAISGVAAASGSGREVGNGGDTVRLDVISIRNYIYENCSQWKTLAQAGVKADVLRAKMDEVGTGLGGIQVEEEIVLADGISRSGRNRPEIPDVAFSRIKWRLDFASAAADEAMPLKVGIVLHEYLGLLGVEKTDDYTVSNKVVNELRAGVAAAGDVEDTVRVIFGMGNTTYRAMAIGDNAAYDIGCQEDLLGKGATGTLLIYEQMTAQSLRQQLEKDVISLEFGRPRWVEQRFPDYDSCAAAESLLASRNAPGHVVVRLKGTGGFSVSTKAP
jgi:hypothetical protein